MRGNDIATAGAIASAVAIGTVFITAMLQAWPLFWAGTLLLTIGLILIGVGAYLP